MAAATDWKEETDTFSGLVTVELTHTVGEKLRYYNTFASYSTSTWTKYSSDVLYRLSLVLQIFYKTNPASSLTLQTRAKNDEIRNEAKLSRRRRRGRSSLTQFSSCLQRVRGTRVLALKMIHVGSKREVKKPFTLSKLGSDAFT